MNKRILFFGFIVLLLLCGFFTLNKYIYLQKQQLVPVTPYQGTLTGEYVCLPHRNTEGPQTLECALGMKTESGEYYSLDFNPISQTPPNIRTGETITVSGQITPVEMLSSDHWRKYPIVGIMSVSSLVERN